MSKKFESNPFLSADEEITEVEELQQRLFHKHDAFKLAFADKDFLLRDELRPVRLQLELLKPELIQQDHGIESSVVIFGSARIPAPSVAQERIEDAKRALQQNPDDKQLQQALAKAKSLADKSHFYDEARRFGQIVSSSDQAQHFVIKTGGGPGVMEAANRGAADAGAKSIAMSIAVSHEREPNPYITPELTFHFHYFAIRKMHLLIRAKALVAFPGGFGTLDELIEALTLLQTKKMTRIPVLLFGENFWRKVINFEALVEEGMVAPEDLALFEYVETAEQAWAAICRFYDIKQ
ncbi:MAG: hypothetical protein CMF50_02670 [Legionellales bacterium]|nr:hypothetical protein [Legionellales bacterium]|tara:strand:+ start:939 stop:1820 length:882 start_codon:yes stop_codon:yes gene_type:complete